MSVRLSCKKEATWNQTAVNMLKKLMVCVAFFPETLNYKNQMVLEHECRPALNS